MITQHLISNDDDVSYLNNEVSDIKFFKRFYIGKRGKGHRVGTQIFNALTEFLNDGYPSSLDDLVYNVCEEWIDVVTSAKFDVDGKTTVVNSEGSTTYRNWSIVHDISTFCIGIDYVVEMAEKYERYELCHCLKLVAKELKQLDNFDLFYKKYITKK